MDTGSSHLRRELQTSGSAFHCRSGQTHWVVIWHTHTDSEGQYLRCGSAQPKHCRVLGPCPTRGKKVLISSGSWMVSEPSDLPLRQVNSLLPYWCKGKLYGKLNRYSHLKKITTFPSLWQASKNVYILQGKLEQFLKSTRRRTIPFKMSRACSSLGSTSSALSAGLAGGAT